MLILAWAVLAAPAPFHESGVAPADFETGTRERAQAMLRWAKAHDMEAQLSARRLRVNDGFRARLRLEVAGDGRTARLRLEGPALPNDRALFYALLDALSRPSPLELGRPRLALQVEQPLAGAGMFGRAELRLESLDGLAHPPGSESALDRDIRTTPPRLLAPSRR